MDEEEQVGLQATVIAFILGASLWAFAIIGVAHLLGWNWHQCAGEFLQ